MTSIEEARKLAKLKYELAETSWRNALSEFNKCSGSSDPKTYEKAKEWARKVTQYENEYRDWKNKYDSLRSL